MKNNIIYKGLSYVWRNTILKWYRDHKKDKEEKYWTEHEKRFGGENPDKTFYVIRRRDWYCGLFSLLLTNLQRIDDALKAGYIPVVDMQNDFNIYLSEDLIGKENAWEYYFSQPCGYSLSDIRKSKHVIIGSGAVPDMFPYLDVDFLYGKTGELEYWRELTKKYIRLTPEAEQIISEEHDRLISADDRVLGVICRGTDYTAGKPKNHPVQPTVEQMMQQIDQIIAEYHCNKIFLATEDAVIYKKIKGKYGEQVITNKSEYVSYHGGSIGKMECERMPGRRVQGMEYLTTIMLLARCNCLCAGCVSGTVGALLFTEGYEYTYLFDLGIYE